MHTMWVGACSRSCLPCAPLFLVKLVLGVSCLQLCKQQYLPLSAAGRVEGSSTQVPERQITAGVVGDILRMKTAATVAACVRSAAQALLKHVDRMAAARSTESFQHARRRLAVLLGFDVLDCQGNVSEQLLSLATITAEQCMERLQPAIRDALQYEAIIVDGEVCVPACLSACS